MDKADSSQAVLSLGFSDPIRVNSVCQGCLSGPEQFREAKNKHVLYYCCLFIPIQHLWCGSQCASATSLMWWPMSRV